MILSKNAALGQHFLFLPTGIMRKTRMRAAKASPKGKRTRSEMKRSGMSDRGKRGCVCKLEKKKCSGNSYEFWANKANKYITVPISSHGPFSRGRLRRCALLRCGSSSPSGTPLQRASASFAHPNHLQRSPNSHLTVRHLQDRSNRLTLLFWPCIMKPPKRTERQT